MKRISLVLLIALMSTISASASWAKPRPPLYAPPDSEKHFKVSPVPTDRFVRVEPRDKDLFFMVRIYDMRGALLQTKNDNTRYRGNGTIDMAGVYSGTYMVEFVTLNGKRLEVHKVTKYQ